MPRTERARRPPEAENRAHIPRAIASREAMLWQGCSLSPRELERKAPRSVWATQLPASRPIRWIARESREANRTDAPRASRDGLARFLSDKLHPHSESPRPHSIPLPRPRTFARAPARPSDKLRPLSPALGSPTPLQPFPNTDMDGINRHATTTQPSFGSNTRTTRFRLNHPTSLKSGPFAKVNET